MGTKGGERHDTKRKETTKQNLCVKERRLAIMTRKVFSLLLLLHLRFSPCRGRGCTTSSPGYDPEVPDYSGVSPIEEPPTRIGSAILYKCPGVKTFKVTEVN